MTTATNSFDQHDKAMDVVIAVLGDELKDTYNIWVHDGVCKVFLPMHVPLDMLSGRDDLTVNLINNTSEITVH